MDSNQDNTGLLQGIRSAMSSDDVETMVNLFAPDAEWVLVPTGETYHGRDQIRVILKRAEVAREHTAELNFNITNSFTNTEQTKLCIEYLHKGLVTDRWPGSSSRRPAPGTEFELPIVWICETLQGKIVKMHEYFDMQTLIDGGTKQKLFS